MQLLLLALIVILGFFVFFAIGIISSLIIFPVTIQDLMGGLDLSDPDLIPVLKNLQIWQSLGIFVIPSVIIAWSASENTWGFIGLSARVNTRAVIWVILMLLVAMPAINQLVIWNEGMSLPDFMSSIEEWMKEREEMAAGLTNSFLLVDDARGFIVNILMIAIIPAFGEEFFFRGILQKLFGRWFKSGHLAVILASILFSALHFQFYGFIPRFILGLIFGYLYLWSGNLWYPIIAHLFNNIIPVAAYYIYGEEAINNLDKLGTGEMNMIWVGISIFLTAIALYKFKILSSANSNSKY